MADSALAVARCSHLILGTGCPGLRQLANAAGQGQWASSSNPLRLYCVFDQSQSGDRLWALGAPLSVSPSTVQNTNNITRMLIHYYVRSLLCYPPTLVDFLWGICPEQC